MADGITDIFTEGSSYRSIRRIYTDRCVTADPCHVNFGTAPSNHDSIAIPSGPPDPKPVGLVSSELLK
jgi:hypothetical protein